MRIVLASKSPRRKEILSRMGLSFRVVPSEITEDIPNDPPHHLLPEELARRKAQNVCGFPFVEPDSLIIGGDTVVCHREQVLGKPGTEEEAAEMLSRLSGSEHEVVTGLCVVNPTRDYMLCDHELTRVTFRRLTMREIRAYIQTGECWDKAGSYAIQGRGSVLVSKICGSYDNVVGLPSALLISMLEKVGFEVRTKLFR